MSKLVKIVLTGVLVAAAIIGVVVVMTPFSDEVTSRDSSPVSDIGSTLVPSLAPKRPPTTLDLPKVRLVKETKALQEELREAARVMTETFPEDSGSWHLAAQVESELSQSAKAEEYWGRCLELKPRHFGPYLGLAELLTSKGQFQDATQVLQKVFELGGSTGEVYLKLGEAYENQGMLKESLEALTTGVKLFPQESRLLYGLGRLQAQSEQLSEAEENLKRAITLGGESKQTLSTLAGVLMRLKKRDEAITVRERLKEISNQASSATGQGESAFQLAYDAALSIAAFRIFEGCGNLCYQQSRYPLAEKYLVRAIGQDPSVSSVWIALSEVLLHQSKYGDVIQVLEQINVLEPKNMIHRVNLASIALKVGDVRLAESALDEALKIDPNSELVLVTLTKLHAAVGNFDKAKEAVTMLMKLNSSPDVLQLKDRIEKAANQAGTPSS